MIEKNDIFGFGKIIDKLPLQKLTAMMTYCILIVIIVFTAMGAMYLNKEKPEDFPVAWDMRAACLLCAILLFWGMFNQLYKKSSRGLFL